MSGDPVLYSRFIHSYIWTVCTAAADRYKVRESGRVVTRAIYNILGVDIEGKKDLIGMYVSETEGAKFCGAARAVISHY